MANPLLSYAHVQEALDRALASERGISLNLTTYGRAVHFRQQVYRLRTMLRKQSLEIYQPTDFMYNRTVYDCITVPNPVKESGEIKLMKTVIEDLEVKEL